jgi:phage shock protein E
MEEPLNKKLVLWLAAGAIAIIAVAALAMPVSAVNKNVGNDEFAQLQSAGALVVDVRTEGEFTGGHIPGAVNVPVDTVEQVAPTWDKDQPIAVYCATGARSANAAAYLAGQGFQKVYNLEKGIASWTGEVAQGQSAASGPTGAGAVKTSGKPLFIDFSSTS